MNTETERWPKQAKHDFDNAERTLESGLWDICMFLAQQVAEKALKAVIAERTGGPPPRLHSIQKLADLADLIQQVPREALRLDDYYINTRYPDAVTGLTYESLLESDAKDALDVAKRTLEVVRSRLKGDI